MNKNVNGAYVAPSCKEYCVNINAVLCASGDNKGWGQTNGAGSITKGNDYDLDD